MEAAEFEFELDEALIITAASVIVMEEPAMFPERPLFALMASSYLRTVTPLFAGSFIYSNCFKVCPGFKESHIENRIFFVT